MSRWLLPLLLALAAGAGAWGLVGAWSGADSAPPDDLAPMLDRGPGAQSQAIERPVTVLEPPPWTMKGGGIRVYDEAEAPPPVDPADVPIASFHVTVRGDPSARASLMALLEGLAQRVVVRAGSADDLELARHETVQVRGGARISIEVAVLQLRRAGFRVRLRDPLLVFDRLPGSDLLHPGSDTHAGPLPPLAPLPRPRTPRPR